MLSAEETLTKLLRKRVIINTSSGGIGGRRVQLHEAIGNDGLGTLLLAFDFMCYPSCCALTILHNFYIAPNTVPKTASATIDICVRAVLPQVVGSFSCRRIQMMMVGSINDTENKLVDVKDNNLVDWKLMRTPKVYHQPFYEWASSKAKMVNTLMFNRNTNNLIHNLEIILAGDDPILTGSHQVEKDPEVPKAIPEKEKPITYLDASSARAATKKVVRVKVTQARSDNADGLFEFFKG